MEILQNNKVEEIKKIVSTRGKYQKVMLLYDDYVSNLEMAEIYNAIKEICIFNKFHFADIDSAELNNGYRVVIYLCVVQSFLNLGFEKSEFINIYCPKDNGLLPYFLNAQNTLNTNEDYLILEHNIVDVGILTSVYFNKFINYFVNILAFDNRNVEVCSIEKEITYQNIMEAIQCVDNSVEFFDLKLIKKYDLDYKFIVLVDLLFVNAFILFLQAVKNQNLMLVDVYKATKGNDLLIDKFYAILTNESTLSLVTLNYNCLISYCVGVKNKILNCLELFNFSNEDVRLVSEKAKDYSKNDEGIFAFLYLFNIFGV